MKLIAVIAMSLGIAAPAFAQERSVAIKDLIGAAPEVVRERIGLTSSDDWTYRLVAWRDGRRYEMLRPKFTSRSLVCPGKPRFSLSGSRPDLDSFLFVDGALVTTIAFVRGPPTTWGPETSLRFEEGVGRYLTDVAAESADEDARLTADCYPDMKFKRPSANPGEIAYAGFALVMFSPYLVSNVFKGVGERAAFEKAREIMPRLQAGTLLNEGPEAFAKSYAGQVHWIPSAHTPGYGILTVDRGAAAISVMSGRRSPDDLTGDAAKVGVRDGRVEWLAFDSAGPYCGRMRENISSYRPGCRQGAEPFGTR